MDRDLERYCSPALGSPSALRSRPAAIDVRVQRAIISSEPQPSDRTELITELEVKSAANRLRSTETDCCQPISRRTKLADELKPSRGKLAANRTRRAWPTEADDRGTIERLII